MSYIGRTPTVGNFQICDAISTVNNQAAYTMQVGSVNVLPETANHMIVSLNGVIQKPNSSFTVSGSTITFASNLVTGDVINFIQILGNVLDLGVPSDATVSTAKLASTSVTAAKLNNDIISGTTALTSEPADTDEFLVSDAGVLKRIDYSLIKGGGITGFDAWRLTSNYTGSSGTIDGSWERQDLFSENIKLGTGMSQSSGVFTFPNTGIWQIGFWTEFTHSAASDYNGFYLDVSANGGTNFTHAQGAWSGKDAANRISTIGASIFINVSNATNYRIKAVASGTNNATYDGNTTTNYTYFTFIRLGDST